MGDPEKDGSLHRDEWGATLREERKIHLNPHLLVPDHRRELLSTIIHEALHITQPTMEEKDVEKAGNRLADFLMANPHIHALLARYKPKRTGNKCPCGRK